MIIYFSRTIGEARKEYLSYLREAVAKGRRPELIGGGLIRSLGGWEEVKKLRLRGQDRVKGDEWILGETDFVIEILTEADEKYNRQYELRTQGYDLDKIAKRVASIYDVDPQNIFKKGRQRVRVEVRDLLCYWVVHELGISKTEIVRRLGMSVSAIGYAVKRGEVIVRENKYQIRVSSSPAKGIRE